MAVGQPISKHIVLCVHGLTVRAGTSIRWHAGYASVRTEPARGSGYHGPRTERLAEKNADAYQLPTYTADMLALLAELKPTTLDSVGTTWAG
jgi:hypothetical protein